MPDPWKRHCPIGEDDSLARRQVWRDGWQYRKEHGPGNPTLDISSPVMDSPGLLAAWLRGYSTADRRQRDD
jgi:hypothetical protein